MDMKAATQTARQMAQFFRVFKDVEEVLEAAAQAQNLMGEVQGQISSLTAERAKVEEEVRNAKAHLQRVKDAFQAQLAKQAEEQNQRVQSFEAEFSERQRKGREELAAASTDLEVARQAHSDFLAKAGAERAAVEKELKGLQDQLSKLKAKVGAL